jgi:hypothetical protein
MNNNIFNNREYYNNDDKLLSYALKNFLFYFINENIKNFLIKQKNRKFYLISCSIWCCQQYLNIKLAHHFFYKTEHGIYMKKYIMNCFYREIHSYKNKILSFCNFFIKEQINNNNNANEDENDDNIINDIDIDNDNDNNIIYYYYEKKSRNGLCKIKYDNGDEYFGFFTNDEKNGNGIFYEQKNNVSYFQKWDNNILLSSYFYKNDNYTQFLYSLEIENEENLTRDELEEIKDCISHEIQYESINLNCGHSFDKLSIILHMKNNNRCPLCNREIVNYKYNEKINNLIKKCKFTFMNGYKKYNVTLDEIMEFREKIYF